MTRRNSIRASFENQNSASERLGMSLDDQMGLFYAISGLAKTVRTSHIQPLQTKATLLGIPLENPPHSYSGQQLAMALNYSTTEGGSTDAEISITDTHRIESAQYQLMPNGGAWAMKNGLYSAVKGYLEHDELIDAINPLFPGNLMLDFLLDKDPSGLDIIRMLEQRLRYPATSKDSAHRYHNDKFTIHGGVSTGDDYVSNVETDFTIVKSESKRSKTERARRSTEYQLSVAALYLTRDGEIKKTYSYSVVPTGINKFEAEGLVTLSSEDDISSKKLKFLAWQDQMKNDPVRALRLGVDSFKTKKARRAA